MHLYVASLKTKLSDKLLEKVCRFFSEEYPVDFDEKSGLKGSIVTPFATVNLYSQELYLLILLQDVAENKLEEVTRMIEGPLKTFVGRDHPPIVFEWTSQVAPIA